MAAGPLGLVDLYGAGNVRHNPELKRFLEGRTPLACETGIWSWEGHSLPLDLMHYSCRDLPPKALITSARAVVLQGDKVLVLTDRDGTRSVVPGGRRTAAVGSSGRCGTLVLIRPDEAGSHFTPPTAYPIHSRGWLRQPSNRGDRFP